jgi:hypothetical protein
MFSVLRSRSKRLATRNRARRLYPETLETRRVLAGSIDFCLPLESVESADVPAEEGSPFTGKFGKNESGHVVKPFRINGGGPAPEGLPLDPRLPAGPHRATGNAIGLGRYTGEGEFSLAAPLEISESGAVTGTFHGTFVFVAANGDRLATIYGEGGTGTLTGQLSQDAEGNPVVIDVEFDAFFTPDPDNSTGRFANVVGGGWTMIAKSESIPLPTDGGGYTAPFDYTWTGTGTLEYAKKTK